MPLPGRDVPFRHRMKIRRYVYVPMRDGVRIACDLYLPVAEGAYPCLLVQTPYNKNGFDVGAAESDVAAGYVLCVADIRGTGGSEGDMTYHNVLEGGHDGADMVEWLAAQGFSTGAVGTYGGSALGFAQYVTAKGRPEHLKAMFIEVAPLHYYLDRWFPGGIAGMAATVDWQDGMTGNISPKKPVEDVSGKPGDVDLEGDVIRKKVSEARYRRRYDKSRDGTWTTLQDRFLELRNAPEDGGVWDVYNHTAFVRECEIPTFYTGVWYDHFVRGSAESYALHKGPRKLLISPGQQGFHGEHAGADMRGLRIRWFDHWLKGEDNGILDEPPVTVFVMGLEQWRAFDAWPPAEARDVTFHLGPDNTLGKDVPASDFTDVIDHDPQSPLACASIHDVRAYEEKALVYTSAELTGELTIVGSPRVTLPLTCSATDGHIQVKLCDVFPDGRSRELTKGRLRLAHREGHDRVVPMPAGEVQTIEVALWPTANQFRAGHRIRLVLGASESPSAEVFPHAFDLHVVSTSGKPATLALPIV